MMRSIAAIVVLAAMAAPVMAEFDAGKVQAHGCYAELASAPRMMGSNWEYVIDFYVQDGSGSQNYAMWGFDNDPIWNKHDGQVRQFWAQQAAWLNGSNSSAPSTGDMDMWAPDGGDAVIEGGDTWTLTDNDWAIMNEWHTPAEYASGFGAIWTGIYYSEERGNYWTPSWGYSERLAVGGHVDAGNSYSPNGGGGGLASEDMIYVHNTSSVYSHGEGVLWTLRIVSPEIFEPGDITWSMPAYGTDHSEGGLYDVLGDWTYGAQALRGDFDLDGDVDADDIDLLFDNLGSGDTFFDLTDDGVIDQDDVDEWVFNVVPVGGDNVGTVFGDFNLDGAVDAGDLALLGGSFGQAGDFGWATGDATGDGTVDAGDLALLGGNFGTIVHPVPEPASAALLLTGVVALIKRRK